jgi:hypothetical protein
MRKVTFAVALLLLAAIPVIAAPPAVKDLIAAVPADAQSVVAVDAAKLRAHPLVQSWLLKQPAWTGAHDESRLFLQEAGLDPARDVDAMLVAVLPSTKAVAWFAGRFDQKSLGAAIEKRGGQPFTIGTITAYHLPKSHEHGKGNVVLAFASADLVLLGDEAAVTSALTGATTGTSIAQAELAAGHISVDAPFWAVSLVPDKVLQKAGEAAGKVHGEGAEPIRGVMLAAGTVKRVTAQAFLDEALKFSAVAVADTAENAGLIRDTVKGALAAARLHFQEQAPEMVDVLRGVQVNVSDSVVTVTGAVPVALLEKILAQVHGQGAGHSNSPI